MKTIILCYLFLQFLLGHLPPISASTYPCLASAMQRELSQMWISLLLEFISERRFCHFQSLCTSIFWWSQQPSEQSSEDFLLSSLLLLGWSKMEQIATTLSLSGAKSVYSRKGVQPFQITVLLAFLATVFEPCCLKSVTSIYIWSVKQQ